MKEFQLYIVPTPIGNIQDITFRAVEILKFVDVIACEDSRVTRKLLNHYNISTKLISYHKYNEKSLLELFMGFFAEGKKIALVSDAGTPMICDPGSYLIKELIKNNITFTALPGACAITTFLSQIPRDNEEFTFVGFVPRGRNEIEEVLQKHISSNLVFYDSPNRILKTLEIVKSVRGNAKIVLSRELTKLFEETKIDTVDNVIKHYADGIKGEIVCMVYKSEEQNSDIVPQISKLQKAGYSTKDISKILSILTDKSKNDIYEKISKVL